MFQEYPKMLYREDKYMIVSGEEHEATARSEGWHGYGELPAIKPASSAQSKQKPASKG